MASVEFKFKHQLASTPHDIAHASMSNDPRVRATGSRFVH